MQYYDEPIEKTIERMKDIKNWIKTTENTCTLGREFGCSCQEDSDKECTNNQESYRLIGTEIYLCPSEIENNFEEYMKFDEENITSFIKNHKYHYSRQFDKNFKSYFQKHDNNKLEESDDESEEENDKKEENSANN